MNETLAAAQNETIQTYTVGFGDVSLVVNAIGAVEATDRVQLSMSNPGRVQELLVQEGDYVLAGDVLLRQVAETEQINYEQAELNLQLAQIDLDELLAPVDEDDIRVAEANVRSAWASYNSIANAVSNEDLNAAQLRIDQAQSAVDEAIRRRTTAQGGQSDEAYAILDAQVGQATFNLEIARQRYSGLQSGNQGQLGAAYARALQAERDLERVKTGPTQYQVELTRIALEQAQIRMESAASALAQRVLLAPFDGVISAVNVELGSLAGPNVPLVVMTDVSSLHVMAEVDEVDIRRITEGMQARVQFDALRSLRLPAQIESIALLGNDSGGIVSYDVTLALDELDLRVRDGMTAEAAVIVDERQNVVMVPNQFIRLDRETGRAYVNLMGEDSSLEEIAIELGLQGQDSSEVVAGLNSGDVIALDLSADRISFFGG